MSCQVKKMLRLPREDCVKIRLRKCKVVLIPSKKARGEVCLMLRLGKEMIKNELRKIAFWVKGSRRSGYSRQLVPYYDRQAGSWKLHL